jgi:hypothetical protein
VELTPYSPSMHFWCEQEKMYLYVSDIQDETGRKVNICGSDSTGHGKKKFT